MGLISLFHRTFRHGVHPPQLKDQTMGLAIRRMPFPPRVILPLSQHIGRAAKPLVRVGQEILRGEPVAVADGYLSVPHHSPVTGVVEAIQLMPSAQGPKTDAILIRAHQAASQRVLFGIDHDPMDMTPEALLEAVQSSGIVGLGGAGFPSHVKLAIPPEHRVDVLLVNGCECEPFLTADHRLMLERADELMVGIRIAMKAVGVGKAVIGIEDNKPDAIAALRALLPDDGSIRCEAVQTKYPQGAEKLLIKVLLNREVPSGGFPFQVGVVVNNVTTLAEMGRLLPHGHGLIERVVTVAGAVERPGNYVVPMGTPLRFVLEQVGFHGSLQQIILGGPMMGMTVASLDVPVTKTVGGILVLPSVADAEGGGQVYPCIGCGYCIQACPMNLNPSQLAKLASKRLYEGMAEDFHLQDCFECGSCSYVCPSRIPLVQYFRIAKAVLREQAA